LDANKLTLLAVDTDLVAEQNNHQNTRDTLLNTQNNLTTVTINLIAAQQNTIIVNTQWVTVRQEFDSVEVGDFLERSCPVFLGKQLDDAIQHVRNVKFWMATKI